MAPNGDSKLRICVLQSSYEGSGSELTGLDPYRTPEIHDPEGKYEWHHEYIKKASSLSQIRALAHSKKYDVFLNLCDGAEDEDRAGKDVVFALHRYGCAYTGADTIFYEPSKELMKKMAYYYDIGTAPWTFIYEVDMQDDSVALSQVEEAATGLKYPLIVKHFQGYSSVGMGPDCKVYNSTQLMQQVRKFVGSYGGALVEEFISGREFTVLVVENAQDPDSPHTLLPVECVFQKGEEAPSEQFKHFDLKWKDYESISWVPVDGIKEPELDRGLREAAAKAFVSMRGCSYGRCDFRVDAQGNIYYLEINDNCGIFYPADEMGSADIILSLDPKMRHLQFIDHIVACALARQQRKVTSKLVEPRYKHGVGYGMYVTRDVAIGEVVIKYEERPFVLVTRKHVAATFGPQAVPGPSPVDVPTHSNGEADHGAKHSNGVNSANGAGGETAAVSCPGSTGLDFKQLKGEWFKAYAFPISDEVWVTWSENPDDWLPLNHGCDPNTWLVGLDLVARRPIQKGEQVTADYCTYSVHNMNEFQCKCGAAKCRGLVKGTDYLEDWVQEEYGDHISAYVASKRAQFKAQSSKGH